MWACPPAKDPGYMCISVFPNIPVAYAYLHWLVGGIGDLETVRTQCTSKFPIAKIILDQLSS